MTSLRAAAEEDHEAYPASHEERTGGWQSYLLRRNAGNHTLGRRVRSLRRSTPPALVIMGSRVKAYPRRRGWESLGSDEPRSVVSSSGPRSMVRSRSRGQRS